MSKRTIYAKTLLQELDFYHLASHFYRYIYRHPELEENPEWRTFKGEVEDFLVTQRFYRPVKTEMTPEEYREFLVFYTNLETKYPSETIEFIFDDKEKEILWNVMRQLR